MRKKILLPTLLISGLILAGCNLINNQESASITTTPTENTEEINGSQTLPPTTDPAAESLNDLDQQLQQTVDDGGQAEIEQLEQESTGL